MERSRVNAGRRTFLAGLAACFAVGPAKATPHGWDPTSPFSHWVEGLRRPDYPSSSCCGKGDLYTIVIDEDALGETPDLMGTARILDGSARRFPDGTYRIPIENGTVFKFPKSKVNPPKDGNPGPSAYAFLGAAVDQWDADEDKITPARAVTSIWCVIPLPGAV